MVTENQRRNARRRERMIAAQSAASIDAVRTRLPDLYGRTFTRYVAAEALDYCGGDLQRVEQEHTTWMAVRDDYGSRYWNTGFLGYIRTSRRERIAAVRQRLVAANGQAQEKA